MARNLTPSRIIREAIARFFLLMPMWAPRANRQAVERYLVEHKGYRAGDIEVDAPMELTIGGKAYSSTVT